jgi:hypothetical protein
MRNRFRQAKTNDGTGIFKTGAIQPMFSKGMVHAMGNGMLAVHKGAVTVKYHQSQQIFRHSQTLYYVPATLLAWQSIMAIDRRNCGKAVFAIQIARHTDRV